MKLTFTLLLIWGLAIGATAMLLAGTSRFTFVGPLLAMCMIATVVAAQRLQRV